MHFFHLKLLSSYALVFPLFYVNKLELRLLMKAPLLCYVTRCLPVVSVLILWEARGLCCPHLALTELLWAAELDPSVEI